MTSEQKSKQASQNANASRLAWQRQAIANGKLANERWIQIVELDTRIAELQARNEDLAQTYISNINRLNLACRQAENEADLWRTKAHDLDDADVQRRAADMAKGGAT